MKYLRTVSADSQEKDSTRYLYWWLLVSIFVEYARPGAFVPVFTLLKLNTIIPLSLFVATLFARGLRPYSEIFADHFTRWLTAFVGLILISMPLASVTLYAYTTFKLVLGYYFLFLVIARVATSTDRLRGIFKALIASHVVLIAITPEIITNPSVRSYVAGGTFLGDGNDFALSLCILIPMTVELALGSESRWPRVIAWASCVFVLLAIITSQSRGASVAVIVLFGFLWLVSKKKFAVLVAIGCVGLLVAVYASDSYFQRMGTISTYRTESSAEGRINAWKASIRMAVDHPIAGVGAGNYPSAYGRHYISVTFWSPRWMTAHSMYFLALGELGFPGLIVVGVLVFGGIFAAMGARRRVLLSASDPPQPETAAMARLLYLMAGSMLALSVAGAFLSVTYYPHIFVLTGILLAARAIPGQGQLQDMSGLEIRRGRAWSKSRRGYSVDKSPVESQK